MDNPISQRDLQSTNDERRPGPNGHTIECADEQLTLCPPCPAMAEQLITVRQTAVPDDRHGYRLTGLRESLLSPEPPRPNAGLAPAVAYLLGKAGQQRVELRRSSPSPVRLPAVDGQRVAWLGLLDTDMLRLVRDHERGLIRHDSRGGVDPVRLINEIALAYPTATVAVVVASASRGANLARRLTGGLLGEVALLTSRSCNAQAGRVVVGTPYGMAHDSVEFGKRDIVIFPRAQDAVQHDAQIALTTPDPHFRLFGMIPAGCTLAPCERDWITATYGFHETMIPRHGCVNRPIRVIFAPIRGDLRLPQDVNSLNLKRSGIWRHPVRNRRVSRIASAISVSDSVLLRQHLPQAASILEEQISGRIAVVVESIEHALNLAERLHGWPVVTGEDVIRAGLDAGQRQLLDERQGQPGGTGPCIATAAGLTSMDLTTVGVIVWTGAGAHLPPIPVERLICSPHTPQQLLLVDLDDRHHPQLRRWTRDRQAAYLDAGWLPPGLDPVVNRVEMFLARRPTRTR